MYVCLYRCCPMWCDWYFAVLRLATQHCTRMCARYIQIEHIHKKDGPTDECMDTHTVREWGRARTGFTERAMCAFNSIHLCPIHIVYIPSTIVKLIKQLWNCLFYLGFNGRNRRLHVFEKGITHTQTHAHTRTHEYIAYTQNVWDINEKPKCQCLFPMEYPPEQQKEGKNNGSIL